ncbi:RNA-processing protein [Candidatus Woesearchaeota archaeon]|nr:RNA-processing protein [Candidatus Woesearchaeota archaeon]
MNEHKFSYEMKIPEERVAVLIGKDGETKKEVEEATNSILEISKEGDVVITGDDGLLLFNAREVVHAIARGFNPRIALLLLKGDYSFEIIDMKDVVGKSKNTLERLKGRVIGRKGRARQEIENLTDTHISVYGKTIGIIGETQYVAIAREAIAMLLSGSMHKTVYRYLERKRKEILLG